MKSLDETIKAGRIRGRYVITDNATGEDTICDIVEEGFISDALYYLKMYKELANDSALFAKWKENPPLTWAELQTMIGKPVWIEYNLDLEDENFRKRSRAWFIIDYFKPYNGATLLRSESGFVFVNYQIGIQWQAYRKERE